MKAPSGIPRLLPHVLLSLLIGSIATIASAWASSQPPPMTLLTLDRAFPFERPDPPSHWPRTVPANWPAAPEVTYRRSITVAHREIETLAFADRSEFDRNFVYELTQIQSGWPFKSMERQAHRDYFLFLGSVPGSPQPAPSWRGGLPLGERRYPLRPLWPGFAVSTFIYAGIAAVQIHLLQIAWIHHRSRWRCRRNLCTRCGYQRTGLHPSTPCPECGGGHAP